MLATLATAFGLMAMSVAIHAAGLAVAMHWIRRSTTSRHGIWGATRFLIAVAGWVIFVHLIGITVWAIYYVWNQSMPDLASALYFSAVTYTTTGYGDLVLPKESRLLGAVEALTGILMCGCSTGFFFAILSQMYVGKAEQTRREHTR